MQKKHDNCLVKGCGKESYGKQYCDKHATPAQRRKLGSDLSAAIRSHCHGAVCKAGEAHEYGEQYCTKCSEPCRWTMQRQADGVVPGGDF